jgi:hypothetical protein
MSKHVSDDLKLTAVQHYLKNNNYEAIKLLKDNQDSLAIDLRILSGDSSIFILDYKQMKTNFEPLAEEIIAKALHPKRMIRYMEQYNFDFEDWFD